MKKLLFTTIAILIALHAVCQEDKLKELEKLEKETGTAVKNDTLVTNVTTEIGDTLIRPEPLEEPEIEAEEEISANEDTVIVEVGDEIFSIKEMGDETRIKIGKKVFRVVENNDGVVVFKSSDTNSHPWRHDHDRFRGHLGGLELGFDGFLTDYWSTSLEPEDSYFDLNTTKSYYWNLTLPCVNIPFSRHIGVASSLGLSINKYRFDGNNSIIKGDNGVIGPSYPEEGVTYSKSKLVTTYATLPVILEAQIPLSDSHRTINLGAGVIGAAKLGAHTKVVYYTDGKQKEKNKDDFSLNTFRWGATARIGYEFFQITGTCYFTSLFEEGKGPELFPYEVGIAFTFND
jgi:hypothetical protein